MRSPRHTRSRKRIPRRTSRGSSSRPHMTSSACVPRWTRCSSFRKRSCGLGAAFGADFRHFAGFCRRGGTMRRSTCRGCLSRRRSLFLCTPGEKSARALCARVRGSSRVPCGGRTSAGTSSIRISTSRAPLAVPCARFASLCRSRRMPCGLRRKSARLSAAAIVPMPS